MRHSLRDRADRRRLRALIDAGEILEAHGLLGRAHELARLANIPPPRPRGPATGPLPRLWRPRRVRRHRTRSAPGLLAATGAAFLWFAAPCAAVVLWLARLLRARIAVPAAPSLRVWLGDANGLLAARGRTRRPPRAIVLDARDLGQNLLVLGGIGSGKTTSVIQPLLLQALAQDAGGLVFDIKGDFGQAVHALARRTGRVLTTIGPGKRAFNLLRGLTPETAASFLRSALLLAGAPGDPFWVETAVELCRNALGVLSFVPESYHLAGLYQYLFHDDIRARIDAQLHAEMVGLSPQALRLLRSYQAYHEGVFTRFDSKVAAGVLASCAQVLTPFTHPDLVDAFCPPADAVGIEGLGRGEVVLVDLPLSVWGTGAKVIYTFLKLRFFQFMQRRPSAERARPVLFVCDEYQEIVSANKDGLSDLNFWDKGRAFGTVGVLSAQSIASFYAAVGDRDLADTLLQNFRQKICLRSDDLATVEFFHRLLGAIEPRALRDLPVAPARLLRRLRNRQALVALSLGGEGLEDVIDLPAVFTA